MAEVKLIGMLHFDSHPERRRRALEIEHPDLVTQELSSEQDCELLLRGFDKVVREGFIPDIITQNVHFQGQRVYRLLEGLKMDELLIPRAYAREHRIPLQYIDHVFMEQHRFTLQKFLPGLEVEWINMLNKFSYEEICTSFEAMYERLQQLHQGNIDDQTAAIDALPQQLLGNERDTYTARKLTNIASTAHGKIVHLCGMYHTLDDRKERTLFSKLRTAGQIDVSRSLLQDY